MAVARLMACRAQTSKEAPHAPSGGHLALNHAWLQRSPGMCMRPPCTVQRGGVLPLGDSCFRLCVAPFAAIVAIMIASLQLISCVLLPLYSCLPNMTTFIHGAPRGERPCAVSAAALSLPQACGGTQRVHPAVNGCWLIAAQGRTAAAWGRFGQMGPMGQA